MNIKILVATHKEYKMPDDDMYLPVFVGAACSDLNLPYQRDDEGDNISFKNKTYCELTGIYWAYKNLKAEYIGLNHYRRYFKYKGKLLDKETAEALLSEFPIILPKKRHYYIETVYSQYLHAHDDDLAVVKNILEEKYPEYLLAFNKVMNRRCVHLFNMFIMKKEYFEGYCSFLFTLLQDCEVQLQDKPRVYGFLAERMLDVYLEKNHYSYKEISVLNTESQHWIKKIVAFLRRKINYGR